MRCIISTEVCIRVCAIYIALYLIHRLNDTAVIHDANRITKNYTKRGEQIKAYSSCPNFRSTLSFEFFYFVVDYFAPNNFKYTNKAEYTNNYIKIAYKPYIT